MWFATIFCPHNAAEIGRKWSTHLQVRRRESIFRAFTSNTNMKTIFALLAATFTLCGCQNSAPTSAPPPGAHLSDAQALAIARQAATEHKVDIRKYQPAVVTFMSEFGQWDIFWPNRASTECFDVRIDDKTGKIVSAKVVPIYQTVPSVSTSKLPPNLQRIEMTGAKRSVISIRC